MSDLLPEQGDPQVPPAPPVLKRAAFYVDGFNFYHALDELRLPHLKWLNWQALARMITAQQSETVSKIVFCTASPRHKPVDTIERHARYVAALESTGVDVRQGWFLAEDQRCRVYRCSSQDTWKRHTEKEGDVSLALALINDAYEDVYDTAYLVTSDSDQAPTLRLMADKFGVDSGRHKKTVAVFPNWRGDTSTSKILASTASRDAKISKKMVEQCLFPEMLIWSENKHRRIYRPEAYTPPPR